MKKFRGDLIRELRIKKDMTQTELSKQTGLSQSHISDIEQNLKTPNSKTLKTLSNALGFEMDEYFDGKEV